MSIKLDDLVKTAYAVVDAGMDGRGPEDIHRVFLDEEAAESDSGTYTDVRPVKVLYLNGRVAVLREHRVPSLIFNEGALPKGREEQRRELIAHLKLTPAQKDLLGIVD